MCRGITTEIIELEKVESGAPGVCCYIATVEESNHGTPLHDHVIEVYERDGALEYDQNIHPWESDGAVTLFIQLQEAIENLEGGS